MGVDPIFFLWGSFNSTYARLGRGGAVFGAGGFELEGDTVLSLLALFLARLTLPSHVFFPSSNFTLCRVGM